MEEEDVQGEEQDAVKSHSFQISAKAAGAGREEAIQHLTATD